MKLLIDNALSPMVSQAMRDSGHDAIHVRELGMQAAPDTEIFSLAERQARVIVSADTDFGALLALRRKAYPSFILFRKTSGVRPSKLAEQLDAIVRQYGGEIEDGCIITVSNDHIRVRGLPIQ